MRLLRSLLTLSAASLLGLALNAQAAQDYSDLGHNLLNPTQIKRQTSSCESGNGKACGKLGVHYLVLAADYGIDVKINMRLATHALEKGCNLQDKNSCFFLAKAMGLYGSHLINNQHGVQPDYLQAKTLLQRGCELKDPYACSQLGSLYYEGIVVEKSTYNALKLFEQSCYLAENRPSAERDSDSNGGVGCYQAGGMYLLGKNVKADADKGLDFLEKGCHMQSGKACLMIANYYENLQQQAKADGYMEAACDVGETDACLAYAMKLNDKGDNVTTNKYLQKACDLGSQDGCTLLASNLLSGIGIQADPQKAYQLVATACNEQSALGCYFLADMYRTGLNNNNGFILRAQPNLAIKLFNKACSLNNSAACEEARKLSQELNYVAKQQVVHAH